MPATVFAGISVAGFIVRTRDLPSGLVRAELMTAHAIDEAKKRSYGSGSDDLVAYIKWGLGEADCEG